MPQEPEPPRVPFTHALDPQAHHRHSHLHKHMPQEPEPPRVPFTHALDPQAHHKHSRSSVMRLPCGRSLHPPLTHIHTHAPSHHAHFLRHTKVPRGPGSPPVPVMHSPPRPITQQDQKNWKIPPAISNWKNAKVGVRTVAEQA